MSRRGPDRNVRFLLNTDSQHLEVHDLDNEQLGTNECQINEIIRANNAQYLKIPNNLESLEAWLDRNPSYDGCRYCLPQYHRK